MFGLLHQYLVENRSLYLQGLGLLQLVQKPASYDVINQHLVPPQQSIELSAAAQSPGLQPLMAFLARQLNVAEEHAYSLYESFCHLLAQGASNGNQFKWENLGTFKIDESDGLVFIAHPFLHQLNEPVTAKRVIRKNEVHSLTVGGRETTSQEMRELLSEQTEVSVKKRWWIGALILGLAAIVLIVLKKMQVL